MGAKCSEMAMGTPSKVDSQQAFEEDQEEGEARVGVRIFRFFQTLVFQQRMKQRKNAWF